MMCLLSTLKKLKKGVVLMKIVSILIAILTSISILMCSIFPLALSIQEDIAWQEYLEWEANDPYALL